MFTFGTGDCYFSCLKWSNSSRDLLLLDWVGPGLDQKYFVTFPLLDFKISRSPKYLCFTLSSLGSSMICKFCRFLSSFLSPWKTPTKTIWADQWKALRKTRSVLHVDCAPEISVWWTFTHLPLSPLYPAWLNKTNRIWKHQVFQHSEYFDVNCFCSLPCSQFKRLN